MNTFFGFVVSIIYIGLVIVSANVFAKAGKEASRKYIHILLSNWWIIAMVFFKGPVVASILPGLFIIINYVSYKKDLIKVMERDEGEENKESLGTVYYAISLFVLALLTFGPLNNPFIGLCGIAVMGYGDGLAAVIGQAVNSPKYTFKGTTKSLAGSLAMFLVTLMIFAGYLWYMQAPYVAIKSILVALGITALEAVSIKGTDNLTVPLVTALLSALLI
jgi:phytol kinase